MAKPYSADLRGRVVGAGQDGATIPETAEQLGVSISARHIDLPWSGTFHAVGARLLRVAAPGLRLQAVVAT
jgi:hypothetical protein